MVKDETIISPTECKQTCPTQTQDSSVICNCTEVQCNIIIIEVQCKQQYYARNTKVQEYNKTIATLKWFLNL